MFKGKFAIRAAAGLLAIVMLLASGTAVYGFEGGEYHEFREGDISLYLPEGWVSEESYADEAEDGGAGVPEEIFTAWDESRNSGLELSVYYVMDEARADDYFYIDNDEAEALEYFDEYGTDAIVDIWLSIMEKQGGTTASSSMHHEKEFFDGQWNGFLVTDITGEAEYMSGEKTEYNGRFYVTVRMTDDGKYVVTNALVFQNDGNTALTEEQGILAGEIADEFYDYDYYNVMADIDLSDSMFDDEVALNFGDDGPLVTIIIGIVGVLAPLVVVAAVVVIVVKRVAKRTLGASRSGWNSRSPQDKGAKSLSAGTTGTQQSFDLGDTIGKFKKRQAEKTSFSGREQRAEKRTERRAERRTAIREERRAGMGTERRSTMQMRTREAESAEQRYYASLQTLHKSGLLTKDEMRDMLERHERSRARQRSR